MYRCGDRTLESNLPVLTQGLRIIEFLRENVEVPVFYQRRLPVDAAYLQIDKAGLPTHFILPLPYNKARQRAALHQYGHYILDKEEPDPNLYVVLKKPKIIKKDKYLQSKIRSQCIKADKIAEEVRVALGLDL